MSERVALKLTGLDRAAFKEAHADGSLQFPLLCNTRVSRSVSTGASGRIGASQPDASEQTGASQPGVKTFHMDKIQILEQAEGPQAIPVFQKLRRLTMRLEPPSQEERKHNLNISEEPSRPWKKCRTLSAMPTDDSLEQQLPSRSS